MHLFDSMTRWPSRTWIKAGSKQIQETPDRHNTRGASSQRFARVHWSSTNPVKRQDSGTSHQQSLVKLRTPLTQFAIPLLRSKHVSFGLFPVSHFDQLIFYIKFCVYSKAIWYFSPESLQPTTKPQSKLILSLAFLYLLTVPAIFSLMINKYYSSVIASVPECACSFPSSWARVLSPNSTNTHLAMFKLVSLASLGYPLSDFKFYSICSSKPLPQQHFWECLLGVRVTCTIDGCL